MKSYNSDMLNTILKYPEYMKKDLINKMIYEGLIVDYKPSAQLPLVLPNVIDVSICENSDEKIMSAAKSESVIKMLKEFEFSKTYRHFCYFEFSNLSIDIINDLISDSVIELFDPNKDIDDDCYGKPVVVMKDNQIFFSFSYQLKNDEEDRMKFTVISIFDLDNNIIELRFDKIGIAYKKTFDFYKIKIQQVLDFFIKNMKLQIHSIDFKAVVDYIMSEKKDEVIVYAKRMRRNGTTAYLEAYEDEESILPILGELESFIKENQVLLNMDDNTISIRKRLEDFIKEIEIKSDMPMVKIRLQSKKIRIGITHDYKSTDYSFFMLYGELVNDWELMNYVREYLIGCYKEFRRCV